jgi:hypothetical protein
VDKNARARARARGLLHIKRAQEIKYPSPDGRLELRVADLKVDLIEKGSGKVMVDLGTLFVDPDTGRKEEAARLGEKGWQNEDESGGVNEKIIYRGNSRRLGNNRPFHQRRRWWIGL